MEERNAGKIYQAIVNVMGEIGAIGKDRKNTQQGFMYRGVEDVMNTLQPLLCKHGVFVVPEVLEHTREERQTKSGGNLIYSILKVKHHFVATDGTEVATVTIGEGMDSADKSSNKAMSIAFKYACFEIFCIPTEEMVDPDGESHQENRRVENKPLNAPKTNASPKKYVPLSKVEMLEKYGVVNVEKMVAWLETKMQTPMKEWSKEQTDSAREFLAAQKLKRELESKREREGLNGVDDVELPFPMGD